MMDRPSRTRVESHVLVNVNQIARLEEQHLHVRSASERLAGAVTRAAGTAVFAVAHLMWFASWILINSGRVTLIKPFDPYPFSLLTMIVSLEAIFLSIWILISQNQMTRQADRRAHLDLQINLLAEQESTATLRAVHGIAHHLGVDPAMYLTDASLAEETDIEHLASRMDEAMPVVPGTSAANPPRPGGMAAP
ncbi:MAG TPA: DUF1003 domain-containing protein [Thermoanaerobaculia bacterium]|jgi:uncharacterized membrane protein|nr:DUF1003 domain-containing protein [Thermoanaerobaculia bacterium]